MPKDKDAKAVELIGSPEKLINQIVKDGENRELALQLITREGPPHKQIQHTLVLKRLEKLASLSKKTTGASLKFIKGQKITLENPEGQTVSPVTIPKTSLEGLESADEVFEKLSKGPQHEVLYTALLLQVIEAMISAQENKAE